MSIVWDTKGKTELHKPTVRFDRKTGRFVLNSAAYAILRQCKGVVLGYDAKRKIVAIRPAKPGDAVIYTVYVTGTVRKCASFYAVNFYHRFNLIPTGGVAYPAFILRKALIVKGIKDEIQ